MSADQAGVVWIPNNNAFPNRAGMKPRYIILHGTAGGSSAEAIARYFQSTQGTSNPVSSHYIIGQDGQIVQCVAEADGAWANGIFSAGHAEFWDTTANPNNFTVSIEHCKPSTDNSDQLTPEQQAASFRLIRDICKRWSIPCKDADVDGGITGHFSIDPVNRSDCPGPYPWAQLWQFLKNGEDDDMPLELNDPTVAKYFEDDGHGNWKCKSNGVVLIGANLNFYRSHGGPALFGLPRSAEIYPPTHPHVAIVPCERAILCYDPQRSLDNPPLPGDVYLLHLDSPMAMQLIGSLAVSDAQTPAASTDQATNNQQVATELASLQGKIKQIQQIIG